MLAEIHGKISSTGSNLSDRLEDKLTGDFFGTLRYLPFEHGLKNILQPVDFSSLKIQNKWSNLLIEGEGHAVDFSFWHRDERDEIDLLINFNNKVIGIEVKYLSGLSSEDSIDNPSLLFDHENSINQLSRYARLLERTAKGKEAFLLFLAPYQMTKAVKINLIDRSIISPAVNLGFLSWQDIASSLIEIDLSSLEEGARIIIRDLIGLLAKKDLIHFRGFKCKQTVTHEHYTYKQLIKDTNENIKWPTTFIKEDEKYVYFNRL